MSHQNFQTLFLQNQALVVRTKSEHHCLESGKSSVFSFFHPFKLPLQQWSHSGSWVPLERQKPMEGGEWSSRVCVACATFQQGQSPGTTCQVSEGYTPCTAHQIVHIVEILQKTSTWINITQPNRSGQRGTKCSSASTAEAAAAHLD